MNPQELMEWLKSLPSYKPGIRQVLAHDDNGNFAWVDVSECSMVQLWFKSGTTDIVADGGNQLLDCGACPCTITPGTDCASAAPIAFGTNYSFTNATAASQWFKVASPGPVQIHITLTGTGTGQADVFEGYPCDSLVDLVNAFVSDSTDCETTTPDPDADTLYIKVDNLGFPAALDYTFRIDLGACP